MSMDTKTCSSCKQAKPIDEFSYQNKTTGLRRGRCKICDAEYYAKHKAKNADTLRMQWRTSSKKYALSNGHRTKLSKLYNLSVDEYDRMLEQQDYKCRICGSEDRLCVDHCHETNKVRGLLCNSCNLGISYLKDNTEILRNAIEYLS